ncbi:hypothetical protein HDU98_009132 [Podochytrium sp. JEL0797]|nr:hypothetical protein HDU98_009132 [Podochytrium sp. JEL0797]
MHTLGAFSVLGLLPKRVIGDHQMCFLKAGNCVMEMVKREDSTELGTESVPEKSGGARFWGLTFTTDRFDASLEVLGEYAKVPKAAVQGRGRRIVTVDNVRSGVSVNMAFMSLPVLNADSKI